MSIDQKVLQAYLEGGLSEEENLQVQAWLADHMDNPEVVTLLNATFDNCRKEADKTDEASLVAVRLQDRVSASSGSAARCMERDSSSFLPDT